MSVFFTLVQTSAWFYTGMLICENEGLVPNVWLLRSHTLITDIFCHIGPFQTLRIFWSHTWLAFFFVPRHTTGYLPSIGHWLPMGPSVGPKQLASFFATLLSFISEGYRKPAVKCASSTFIHKGSYSLICSTKGLLAFIEGSFTGWWISLLLCCPLFCFLGNF